MSKTPAWIRQALALRQEQQLFRKTIKMEGPQTPQIRIDGKAYLAFCSNDYLGLATHPQLVAALKQSADAYGVGSGASHLVNGHGVEHQALEQELADWLGYERVLLFSTGYMANLGVISALADKTRSVIEDKLNHASLIDGALLAQAPMRRYLHNNLQSVERLLQKASAGALLVTDGVFSMDGDIVPLAGLVASAERHQALLMVDDAHGLGCLGENGRGSMALENVLPTQVPLLIGTFGKAFGTSGAFVATTHDIADYLTQFARPYIYTTAMSPALAGATRASVQLLQTAEGDDLRTTLAENIAYFRAKMSALPLTLMASSTAIQPILLGETALALRLSERLKQQGIWCTAIRPPTVPVGSARLRVTLSAAHTQAHIDRLVTAIESSWECIMSETNY